MKQSVKCIISILLCLMVVSGSLLLMVSLFLRTTLFSLEYYQEVIISVTYLKQVRQAIEADLLAQSSYVDIPQEVLFAGLNDDKIYLLVSQHLHTVIDYLNYRRPYTKASYPSGLFYDKLAAYMGKYAAEAGFKPSEDQMRLLQEVADDSALIVSKHATLFDLDLIREMPLFQQIQSLLFRIADLAGSGLLVLGSALLGLLILHLQQWRRWLFYDLIGFWLAGSLVMTPAIVLHGFGLTRRLSIGTAYLKYAVDHFLTNANQFFIIRGSIIFLLSSIGLIIYFLASPSYRDKSRRHDN
ncbi:MAG: hypothetical protein Q7J78_06735 [Clostridiales bacterium]|nr:hypothetical protein [Clostridiales bacterium]